MQETISKILVVDDDENICEIVKLYLDSSGYDVIIANDGEEALEKYRDYNPNLIVLDVMLPKIDGIEVLKTIRKSSNIPILMLTAKGSTLDKIQGLELGADDYIVKPFEGKELVARVKAVLRRASFTRSKGDMLNFEGLEIDLISFTVYVDSKEINMPPKEFELLCFLARNKNKVFTREQLLCEVWGYDYPGDSRTVDVHVKRLRSRIDDKASKDKNWHIQTVWGVGYKFEVK